MESVLLEHAAVDECAVVSSPDKDRGEVTDFLTPPATAERSSGERIWFTRRDLFFFLLDFREKF